MSARARKLSAQQDRGQLRPWTTPCPTPPPDRRTQDDMPLPDRAAHGLPWRSVPARLAGGALCRLADRAARGPGDRAEAAAAAAGAADRPCSACRARLGASLAILLLAGARRADQRCRRSGRVLGRQAAGRTAADPAAARLPRAPDRLGAVDDGPAAERHRRRGSGAAGGPSGALVQRDGRAVQRHHRRSPPACSPRWSCCSTCWSRARPSCAASSRSCRASPRSVRRSRSRWTSSATSRPI